jgi:hypothetical protein
MPVWKIAQTTQMDGSTIWKLQKKAISRGWDKENKGLILLDHVTNAPKSGRPPLS